MGASGILAPSAMLALPSSAAAQQAADTTSRVVDRVFTAFRDAEGPGEPHRAWIAGNHPNTFTEVHCSLAPRP